MKIAILTLAYNEAEHIRACVKNWGWTGLRHVVLVSTKPWNGSPQEDDNTVIIAKDAGAEVVIRFWDTEASQREWGLGLLHDYDYVLIVDPDEYYTKKAQERILEILNDPRDEMGRYKKIPAFRAENMVTYWKTPDYVFSPPDSHKPYIAVDPKQVRFNDKRQVQPQDASEPFQQYAPLLPVTVHHFSWVKSDTKVAEKIQSYSHCRDFDGEKWYEDIWLKWQPGSGALIRPYGIEKSVAVKNPAPDEIKRLWIDNANVV